MTAVQLLCCALAAAGGAIALFAVTGQVRRWAVAVVCAAIAALSWTWGFTPMALLQVLLIPGALVALRDGPESVDGSETVSVNPQGGVGNGLAAVCAASVLALAVVVWLGGDLPAGEGGSRRAGVREVLERWWILGRGWTAALLVLALTALAARRAEPEVGE